MTMYNILASFVYLGSLDLLWALTWKICCFRSFMQKYRKFKRVCKLYITTVHTVNLQRITQLNTLTTKNTSCSSHRPIMVILFFISCEAAHLQKWLNKFLLFSWSFTGMCLKPSQNSIFNSSTKKMCKRIYSVVAMKIVKPPSSICLPAEQ